VRSLFTRKGRTCQGKDRDAERKGPLESKSKEVETPFQMERVQELGSTGRDYTTLKGEMSEKKN